MRCEVCRADSMVIDSRKLRNSVRRRRQCTLCGYRFTTQETVIDGEARIKSVELQKRIDRAMNELRGGGRDE